MKQKVIIIGHGYTSRLCVIRSVAQLGCDITVIVIAGKKKDGSLNTKKPIDCYSKYVNRILYCKSDADMLIQLLLEKCVDSNQKVVIIPDSDFSAVVIDSNQDKLKEHFLFPHINHEQGAVMKWMNKEKQKEMAMSVGLNVAESISVEIKDGKYLFPKHVHYPCFTKTQLFLNRNKQTLKRCNNSDELKENLDEISLEYGNLIIMIEEYKEIEKEYAILGFSDGREAIIPGVIQILNLAHGVHYGVACRGKVMPVDGYEELLEKFKHFVLRVGFVGVFDIDFYLCDGVFYFCELNLRIGGSCYAITKMGVNLPAMMVKNLCGENIDSMPNEIKESAVYVNERMCMDDWYFRYISTKEYNEMINSAKISFVKEDYDDGPCKTYKREFRKRQIKRTIKRLLLC